MWIKYDSSNDSVNDFLQQRNIMRKCDRLLVCMQGFLENVTDTL